MKNVLIFALVYLITLSFNACDKCKNLDCAVSNYSAQFRIISKSNGNDLVFGINSVYDKSKIKFFSLNGTDTTFFQYNPIKFGGNNYDSILQVEYLAEPKGLTFIKLNSVDVDTLTMVYLNENTRCCGAVTTISKFIYNNTNEIGSNNEIRQLKK